MGLYSYYKPIGALQLFIWKSVERFQKNLSSWKSVIVVLMKPGADQAEVWLNTSKTKDGTWLRWCFS